MLEYTLVKDFVTSLAETPAGKKQKPLLLYAHLLKHTDESVHASHAQAHVDHFKQFCEANREAIAARDVAKFQQESVDHTPRTQVNVRQALEQADETTQGVVWDHLENMQYAFDHPEAQPEISNERAVNTLSRLVENIKSVAEPLVEQQGTLDNMQSVQAVIGQLAASGVFESVANDMASTFKDMTIAEAFEVIQKFCGTTAPNVDVTKLMASMADPSGLGVIMSSLGADPSALGALMSQLAPVPTIEH